MIPRCIQRSSIALQQIGTRSRSCPHGLRCLSTSPTPTPPDPSPFSRYGRKAAKYTAFTCFSAVLGLSVVVGGVFIHDVFTYSDKHIDRVPVSPLALHPERGGPKNLPVASVLVGDEDDAALVAVKDKPRLVIVGGGWGAVSVVNSIHPSDYHVTVVSPDTFTTFTPLLPSAAVGTVTVRSLVESLRKIIARVHGQLINGRAVDLVMSERLLEVETVSVDGETRNIYVPYDKLVIAVGSVSSTHGVTGLEHCFQLKTVGDAQAIRRRVIDNFEIASLPSTSEEERKRLLSFVICGGGPTGVETAAEIYDLCQEDIINYFPKLLRKEVSIHVIQSREHILNTYSEAISKFAEEKFRREGVELITTARVGEVRPDRVIFTTKVPDTGKIVEHTIPTNFVLWSTGISMNPFTARVSSLLPNQVHKKAIEVDAHLRVKGAPQGDIYAIGDCATIETSLVSHLLELVEEADRNKDGNIDFDEWQIMVKRIKKTLPMAATHLEKVRTLFDLYDSDSDNKLTLNELAVLLQEIGNKITALPATAQVAAQQGKYLGHKLHLLAAKRNTLLSNELPADADEAVTGPFNYRHLGSLAYIGNAAVFDLGRLSFMGGLVAMYAWRSIYWSEQVSMRTRALLMTDWVLRGVWGRDLSRL
ncbi:mitochondrial NADH dehydrogenase [Russula earlei]|uniref:Mitochondrial NADH dehydrogenase n=1 Tax=Russula earlei TaxID=71964 RepID=A0ACC0U278_9AGAM|nr:mitochondrial NADH dehydrogenase [Russula earlei]